MSDSLWPHGLQHAGPPSPSTTPGIYSNSCPLSRWCHPTISSSVIPFSSCLQSFPASGSFQMSQFFASGGQSFGVSASASVLPVNIQDWFLSERSSPEILCLELILPIYIHLLEGFKITMFPSLDLLFEWALQFSCYFLFFHFTMIFIFVFFDVNHFKSLYWIYYNIVSMLCFGFLAVRYMGSELPNQGWNPHPLRWKMES